ncbi:MAG TPA: hypothetical protein VEF04_13850 [Blastocatellia bacterium]|nr:hypothetical protein [Blastocatellia bacterium]
MADNNQQVKNSQTVVIEADEFEFETVEKNNGIATVIRFKVLNPAIRPGDVLLILAGDQIQFHGMISNIEDDWAVAADRTGSLLPALVH